MAVNMKSFIPYPVCIFGPLTLNIVGVFTNYLVFRRAKPLKEGEKHWLVSFETERNEPYHKLTARRVAKNTRIQTLRHW